MLGKVGEGEAASLAGSAASSRIARESPVAGARGRRRPWRACVLRVTSVLHARSRRGYRNRGSSGVKELSQRALDISDAGIDGGQ